MFIDYVTLLLLNMTAGLLLLAVFINRGLQAEDRRRWAPAFGIVGSVALVGGFAMCFTWPLPGSYNSAFGEMSVMLGSIYLGAGLMLALRRDLMPIAVYAFFPGIAAILLGVRIIELGMTKSPVLSGIGFICSGLGGVLLIPLIQFKDCKVVRTLVTVVLGVAIVIWAITVYKAYWDHMEQFQDWKPSTIQTQQSEPPNEGG